MTSEPLLNLLLDAWADFDRAMNGLDTNEATRPGEGSAFAWTLGHCANQVDSLINVRLVGLEPHPIVSGQRFRFGGNGQAEEWESLQMATTEVRGSAIRYLLGLRSEEWSRRVPYAGSMEYVRERGLSPEYAVARLIAHHYLHAGEIVEKRARMGQQAGDYPGLMEHSLGT